MTEETVKRAFTVEVDDDPERREQRMARMIEFGVPRHEVELMDQKAMDLVGEVLALISRRTAEFAEKPGKAGAFLMHVIRGIDELPGLLEGVAMKLAVAALVSSAAEALRETGDGEE